MRRLSRSRSGSISGGGSEPAARIPRMPLPVPCSALNELIGVHDDARVIASFTASPVQAGDFHEFVPAEQYWMHVRTRGRPVPLGAPRLLGRSGRGADDRA